MQGEVTFADVCVQRRLICSVGDSATGVKVRKPGAWIASVEQTKRMKPIYTAIFGMVSESTGRNVIAPRIGPKKTLTFLLRRMAWSNKPILKGASMNKLQTVSLFRRLERWLIALAMAAMAWLIEKAMLRSIRRGGTKP
jgi:hypothetical protein